MNFTPFEWYYSRKRRTIKRLVIILQIIWLINLILLGIFIKNYNKLNNVQSEGIQINKDKIDAKDHDNKENLYRLETLKSFEKLLNNKNLYAVLRAVEIHNKQLQLDFVVESKDEYLNMIDNLETNPKFKIIHLSPLQASDNGYRFNLALEVTNG